MAESPSGLAYPLVRPSSGAALAAMISAFASAEEGEAGVRLAGGWQEEARGESTRPGSAGTTDDGDNRAERKQRRMQSNRESARRSRQRKQQLLAYLKETLGELTREVEVLRPKVASAEERLAKALALNMRTRALMDANGVADPYAVAKVAAEARRLAAEAAASDDAFAPVQSVGVTYPAPASEDGEHAEGLLPSPSFHAVPADTIALSGELLLTQVLGSALAPVA